MTRVRNMFVSAFSPMNSWFENVFGFREAAYEDVRSMFRVETAPSSFVGVKYLDGRIPLSGGDIILHTVPSQDETARRFFVGTFDTPSVENLRCALSRIKKEVKLDANTEATSSITGSQSNMGRKGLSFRHIIGDAGELHINPDNAGAVFQVASQFNALEMPGPRVTPDDGISDYINDPTQGPNCAMACPAATLYRNYFVNEYGQGGRMGRQLDLLHDVGVTLGNIDASENGTCAADDDGHPKYWKVRNGYALPIDERSMSLLTKRVLEESDESIAQMARDCLKVGVHWNTEVECEDHHIVTQVFCSALPVGYHLDTPIEDMSFLACLVLDGLYEATLSVASLLAHSRGERVSVYLTCVGGGVFGNQPFWIIQAIQRALKLFLDEPIDVYLVHFRSLKEIYRSNLPELSNERTSLQLG